VAKNLIPQVPNLGPIEFRTLIIENILKKTQISINKEIGEKIVIKPQILSLDG